MGEARRRGTFEVRKAEAIAAGRIKKPAIKKGQIKPLDILNGDYLTALILGLVGRKRARK